MKLSEAIRKGCENNPQQTGRLVLHDRNSGDIIGTCAIGAAMLGKLGPEKSEEFEGMSIEPIFPIAATILKYVPENLIPPELKETHPNHTFSLTSERMSKLLYGVIHLNDISGWSRKAIAEWVETIEDYVESQKQQEEAPEEEEHGTYVITI